MEARGLSQIDKGVISGLLKRERVIYPVQVIVLNILPTAVYNYLSRRPAICGARMLHRIPVCLFRTTREK